jgi:hypothetical protein
MTSSWCRAGGAQRNPPFQSVMAGFALLHPPYDIVDQRHTREDAE